MKCLLTVFCVILRAVPLLLLCAAPALALSIGPAHGAYSVREEVLAAVPAEGAPTVPLRSVAVVSAEESTVPDDAASRYSELVQQTVLPNWKPHPRDILAAQVRVHMDPSGGVISVFLERSSGRATFDASCANAVMRTRKLPLPLGPDQAEISIRFDSAARTKHGF